MIDLKSQLKEIKILLQKDKKAVCTRTGLANAMAPSPNFSFRHKPYEFVRDSMSITDRLVCGCLATLADQYRHVYISQSAIGKMIGRARETVNISLKHLTKLGIVGKLTRHRRTCIYKLSPLFKLKKIIAKIAVFIPALLFLSSTYLTPLKYLNIREYIYNTKSFEEAEYNRDVRRVLNKKRILQQKLKKYATSPLQVHKLVGRQHMKKEMVGRVKEINELSKTINLSLFGKCKLFIFPSFAINSATKYLKRSLKRGERIHNPFGFVYSSAEKASIESGISIDYSIFDKFQEKHKFSKDENPLVNNAIIHHESAQKSKKEPPMHSAYVQWVKPIETHDRLENIQKYESVDKTEEFEMFALLVGEETARKFLDKNKSHAANEAINAHQNDHYPRETSPYNKHEKS